jgi:hypothetical protein
MERRTTLCLVMVLICSSSGLADDARRDAPIGRRAVPKLAVGVPPPAVQDVVEGYSADV